ncbi:hypothetical protein [Flavobacterium laiguense]|uniref:Uncharacterized protein n=1 Tax=Flavobacterium laiguense TaxID=2169409 RepID=A0A2U1JJY2_9FLAO|nr:hypothetical protein [Flavobacterium laiguense]PWA05299.1 hypothetical protein DB891_17140 [Flavobacterium laiguense]
MADKNTIKNWFLTGLKPTQAQFWVTWDSFWHKDEKIPITAIDDIENILAEKADAEALTNHVSDAAAHADLFLAKEDKNKKGAVDGYAPLNEFTKLAIDYLNVVNDLVTGGEASLLTAEQGKLLQTQINNINILLASDNVNLDNVQELVDAIETIEMSLSSILVNDLTTGGTTKALTAEMGKTLKGLIDAKQPLLGYTPMNAANIATSFSNPNKNMVPTLQAVEDVLNSVAAPITKTKAEIDALITTNGLVAGATYKITGVHPYLYNDGTNSGTTIFLQALTINTLAKEGHGEFWNPKYEQGVKGFGIWTNLSSYTTSAITGTFNLNENITANNGATGKIYAAVQSNQFIAISGDWVSATSIIGNSSGATANISDIAVKVYFIGSKSIWGGYSWTNVNGNIGSKLDVLSLDSEWTKDAYSSTNYNKTLDVIEYDYINDYISRRYEVEGNNNVICRFGDIGNIGVYESAISVFMFGNPFKASTYKGIGDTKVSNSYYECVNFRGVYSFGCDLKTYSVIQNNDLKALEHLELSYYSRIESNFIFSGMYLLVLYESNIQNNNITRCSIYNNTLRRSHISNNIMDQGSFEVNKLEEGQIVSNTCTKIFNLTHNTITDGSIGGNTVENSTITLNDIINSNLSSTGLVSSLIQNNIFNSSSFTSSTNIISKTLKGLVMDFASINDNVSSATILFGNYSKTAYKRPDGTTKLRYYNNSDVLVIANVTT